MFLPENVHFCIRLLEEAGYCAYAVGGCVRDALQGLTPQDYDLCTNALPEETAAVFSHLPLVRSGEKHGTIGVVMGQEVIEITTFRTEGGYQDHRHPDWVEFVSALEEDLARRDFTVNAMAYAPTTGYADPFGGQEDLKNKILRTVGKPADRFREDPLRILRGVRFSVRFGLAPEEETLREMIACAPLLTHIAKERIFDELCKLLPLVSARDLTFFAPILVAVLPELEASIGFLQHTPHHAYDVFTHTALVTEGVDADPVLRWAALLHDCGKPAAFTRDAQGRGHFKGHAHISADLAEVCLRRLKAPTALREEVVLLIRQHMTPLEPEKRLLRRRLGQYGEATLRRLLTLQKADLAGKGRPYEEEMAVFLQVEQVLNQLLTEPPCLKVTDLAINGQDLKAIGFSAGPKMGACLQSLLLQVQDEVLSNEKTALLKAATLWTEQQEV